MKINWKCIAAALVILMSGSNIAALAEEDWLNEDAKIKNDHFYHHIELNYSNAYSLAISSIATGYLNYLLGDAIFENGYGHEIYQGEIAGQEVKYREFNQLGVKARELFNTITPSIRLGYKTNWKGNFNMGVYAMGTYKLDQFETKMPGDNEYLRHRLQYAKAGGGLHFTFGHLESPTRVIVEAGCQYAIPIGYRGFSHDKNQLNKGITSHFSIQMGGPKYLQNIGFFLDYDHFDTFDKNYTVDGIQPHAGSTFHNFTVGFQCSVTFLQGQKRR